MIFTQTLLFIIPAFAFAFPSCFAILYVLDKVFNNYLQARIKAYPSYISIIVAILIGFAVPILASIIPIK